MRTKYSIINMLVSVGGQIPNLVLAFLARAVFVRCLSAEYLGVNGLFSNLLGILSLAELGIGSAMCYSLYDPLARKDEETIGQLMDLYRLLYRIVAAAVLAGGICLFPFMDLFIKEQPDIEGLGFIYFMYLGNSAASYLLSYKQTIILADQKAYINAACSQIIQMAKSVLQIFVLLLTGSFYAYLAVQIFCSLLTNLILSKKADSLYPYLRTKKRPPARPEVRKELFRKIGAMFFHKMGSILVMNTDNLVISAFVGLVQVGVYSNYLMVLNHVKTLCSYVYGAFTAGIGNLFALEQPQVVYRTYRTLNYLMYLIFGYCSAALFSLFSPFICLVFGENYVLPMRTVFLVTLNFYIWGMRQITLKFRDARGLFWYDRYKPFFEVALNLFISVWLAGPMGIDGVILGTIFSSLMTNFWVEPYVFLRYGIREKWKIRLFQYFLTWFFWFFLAAFAAGAAYWLSGFLPGESFLCLIARGICVTAVYLPSVLLFTCRTEESKMLSERMVSLIREGIEKRKGSRLP